MPFDYSTTGLRSSQGINPTTVPVSLTEFDSFTKIQTIRSFTNSYMEPERFGGAFSHLITVPVLTGLTDGAVLIELGVIEQQR